MPTIAELLNLSPADVKAIIANLSAEELAARILRAREHVATQEDRQLETVPSLTPAELAD